MSREQQAASFALEQMKAFGAQAASVQAFTSRKTEFNIDGGKFSLLRTTLDHSLSLQALIDQRRGVVAGNSFEEDAIAQAARDCVTSAQAGQPDDGWELAREGSGSFDDGVFTPDMDKLFDRTRELLDTIHKEYPKVSVEQMIVAHTAKEGVYSNSYGVHYSSRGGQYSVSLMFSGKDGDKSSSFNGGGVVTDNLDTPLIDRGSIRQGLKDAENQIHTQPTQGKYEGTIIFTPDCLGGMLYELLGNFVTDGVLLEGTSLWKDKLGQQVADPRLTVSLRPCDPRMVSSEKWTGEGFLSQDYDVIKDGVLESFMLSAYAANKTGQKRSPNSSYNLVVQPGDIPLADLIKNTKKGLLVSRYSGGAAGGSGEFSGVAKNSFLIEDGKVGQAVNETMISGNLADMLNHLVGISKETVEDGSSVLPWLAVDGITISGK